MMSLNYLRVCPSLSPRDGHTRFKALRVFVWVWIIGLAYGLLASGESEVESAAFEHDQSDEVAEVPVAVANLDGGWAGSAVFFRSVRWSHMLSRRAPCC